MIYYNVLLSTLAEDNIAGMDFNPRSDSGILIPSWESPLSDRTLTREGVPVHVDVNVQDRIVGLEFFDILRNLPERYHTEGYNHHLFKVEEDESGLARVVLDPERVVTNPICTGMAGLQLGYSADGRIVELNVKDPKRNILKLFYDPIYS